MNFISGRSRILAIAVAAIAAAATTGTASADRFKGAHSVQFGELDSDNDGIVTMVELEAYRVSRFDELDTDSDGSLNRAEIAGLISDIKSRSRRHHGDVSEDRLNRWIDRYVGRHDSDENGSLSMVELRTPRIERMMEVFDSDEDGQLTKAEFDKFSKKRRHGWWGWLRH